MKKILLLGDSIRIGYDKFVKEAFCGVAEVYYPAENCQHTVNLMRVVYDYKRNYQWQDDIDAVHWNAGLWDDIKMADGLHAVPIEQYKVNIDRICKIIKMLFPKAKMIFATSTPVQEELFTGKLKRLNKDTEMYNAAAVSAVKSNGGEIDDLYSLLKDAPVSLHSDLTHFYTLEGTKIISNKVIESLENALNIKANPVNYEELFSKEKNILGF